MSGPRFYIVTSDAVIAMRREFWCHAGDMPPSIAVIDDPWAFAKIPNGAKCRPYWYWHHTRDEVIGWQAIWSERVAAGGIEWISEEEWARLKHWVEHNRRRPTLKLLHGITFEDEAADQENDARRMAEPAAPKPVPAPMPPAARQEPVRPAARWS